MEINNTSSGLNCCGSNAKAYPYSNSSSTTVLSYELPNLTTLNTESLDGFLEQCQQKGLDDNRIVHQISEDIKYLIRKKLKSNPAPGYSIAQSYDWETQIPITELLQN